MQQLSDQQLLGVVGGESFGQVVKAIGPTLDVPLSQTYGATTDFIRDHPFFHQGLMNAPIGGGKHFRDVPFVGPARVLAGAATGNLDGIRKGVAVTRATWDAA